MSYRNTFIQVAADCPVDHGVVPVAKGDRKPIHVLQYELLSNNPYTYTHEDLLFEVYIRHQSISEDVLQERSEEIWAKLFQKKHPCLRASLLPKKYGWGVHFDQEGKIALYALESVEYQHLMQAGSDGIAQLKAMRSKRA